LATHCQNGPVPDTKTITLSLTGPASHTIVQEPGRGDLSIGPAGYDARLPDVVVGPDDSINWAAFDPLTVPAGYPWPRSLYYRGNDTGFVAWSARRRIEWFDWVPMADAVVDAHEAQIGRFVVHLRTTNLKIVLPAKERCQHFQAVGDLARLRPERAPGAACPNLEFDPDTKPSRGGEPLALPRLSALADVASVHVRVQPLRQPFDCASLLQFPKLRDLALAGQLTGLDTLARLTELTSLGLRYCPDLSGLPPLHTWPQLTTIIAWNVEETAGKRLRTEIRHLTNSTGRQWQYASAKQLRRPQWFATEYDLPFSAWPKSTARAAVGAFRTAQASITAATSPGDVQTAVRGFVQAINALPGIETSEREDAAEAVTRLGGHAPMPIAAELVRSWFDAARDF
jgi:hypothetical protein